MPNSNIQRRNRVVERHLELAQRLARNFSQRTGLDQDDLFQVAVLGLIKATKAYRSETNVPFEAFARPHVRGAILHYLRDSVAMVRLPRRLEEEAQRLSHTNRPRSSHEQWIQATYRSKTRWQPLPLDLQAGANTGMSMMLNAERRTIVQQALAELQPTERQAVQSAPRRSQSAQRRIQSWSFRHDHPEKGQEWSQATGVEAELAVQRRLGIALHLVLECGNSGVETCQLSLQTIAQEDEHRHFSLLMLSSPRVVIGASVAAERRKHGSCRSVDEFWRIHHGPVRR